MKARDKLSEVLKIDRHNTQAVRAFASRTEESATGSWSPDATTAHSGGRGPTEEEQFVLALDLIQKAMSLHTTDPDLHRLRSSVQDAKTNGKAGTVGEQR